MINITWFPPSLNLILSLPFFSSLKPLWYLWNILLLPPITLSLVLTNSQLLFLPAVSTYLVPTVVSPTPPPPSTHPLSPHYLEIPTRSFALPTHSLSLLTLPTLSLHTLPRSRASILRVYSARLFFPFPRFFSQLSFFLLLSFFFFRPHFLLAYESESNRCPKIEVTFRCRGKKGGRSN